MTGKPDKIVCKHCNTQLKIEHIGPCPSCGKEGRQINYIVEGGSKSSCSVDLETQREYYQKNRKILAVVILITLISPFIGFFLTGPLGIIIGLSIGLLAYIIGPWASTKIIEIHHR